MCGSLRGRRVIRQELQRTTLGVHRQVSGRNRGGETEAIYWKGTPQCQSALCLESSDSWRQAAVRGGTGNRNQTKQRDFRDSCWDRAAAGADLAHGPGTAASTTCPCLKGPDTDSSQWSLPPPPPLWLRGASLDWSPRAWNSSRWEGVHSDQYHSVSVLVARGCRDKQGAWGDR